MRTANRMTEDMVVMMSRLGPCTERATRKIRHCVAVLALSPLPSVAGNSNSADKGGTPTPSQESGCAGRYLQQRTVGEMNRVRTELPPYPTTSSTAELARVSLHGLPLHKSYMNVERYGCCDGGAGI